MGMFARWATGEAVMKKTMMVSAALAACVTMPALAQGGPPPDPYGDATVTKADAETRAGERFAQLDTDHDGSLTPEERRAGFGGGARAGGGAGGPGGLGAQGPQSKAEYVAAQLQRFDMQDADRDGQLTKAERDAFRQQMLQRFQQGGGPGGQ
jgi:hypothetical protein